MSNIDAAERDEAIPEHVLEEILEGYASLRDTTVEALLAEGFLTNELLARDWVNFGIETRTWAIHAGRAPLDQWDVCEDGEWLSDECIRAEDADAAFEKAAADIRSQTDCYRDESVWHTVHVHLTVHNDVTDAFREGVVRVDPDEPGCAARDAHDWRRPAEVVGGSAENPGAGRRGKMLVTTEVCGGCGIYRVTETVPPGQDEPLDMGSLEYRRPDERSLAYIRA